MPKTEYVPPPLSPAVPEGKSVEVEITNVRIVRNQWTSIGTIEFGIALNVSYNGQEYGQLFTIDSKKPVITGSLGRILSYAGISDTEEKDFEKKLKNLIGKTIVVQKRGGKLYWYPPAGK